MGLKGVGKDDGIWGKGEDVRCAGAGGMQRRVISHGNGLAGEV